MIKVKNQNAIEYNNKKTNELIKSDEFLKIGIEYFNACTYKSAIETLSEISNVDIDNYNKAQELIEESKARIIGTSIEKAKEQEAEGKYRLALTYLEYGLGFDSENEELLSLKKYYEPLTSEVENTIPKDNSKLDETMDKWSEKDGSYLGSDEFKDDLHYIEDEMRANATDSGGYSNQEEKIWKYCMDRWEYYDIVEGKYSGDKYTVNVFADAAAKFGITATQAEDSWYKVDSAKLGG